MRLVKENSSAKSPVVQVIPVDAGRYMFTVTLLARVCVPELQAATDAGIAVTVTEGVVGKAATAEVLTEYSPADWFTVVEVRPAARANPPVIPIMATTVAMKRIRRLLVPLIYFLSPAKLIAKHFLQSSYT
jgi:hypothetical protein